MNSIQALRDALNALLLAQASRKAAGLGGEASDRWDGLESAISCVKQILVSDWSFAKAMAEGDQSIAKLVSLDESGAKISSATREVLANIVSALTLLSVDARAKVDAEPSDIAGADSMVAEAKLAIVETVEAFNKATNSNPSIVPAPGYPKFDKITESALPAGLDRLPVETPLIFAESTDSTPAAPKFEMLVIREGTSKNRVKYSAKTLRESVDKLEGRPIYVDHPAGARNGDSSRSLATKAGWWSNVAYKEGISLPDGSSTNGIIANVNLLSAENSPVPWLPGMIKESIERGRPELVGISILAGGKTQIIKENGVFVKEALSIDYYASADAVAEPGAGGQPLSLIANNGVDVDVKKIEEMTLDELKEARPDLYDEAVAKIKADVLAEDLGKAKLLEDTKLPAPTPTPSVLPAEFTAMMETTQTLQAQLAETVKQNQMLATNASMQLRLGKSRLPQSIKVDILAESTGQILTSEAIEALVLKYEKNALAVMQESDAPGRITPNMPIRYGGLVEGTISPLDQAAAALSQFFGAPADPQMAGKFPKIRSFSEFYRNITGDYEFSGYYGNGGALAEYWDRPANDFVEALPGSTHVIGGGTITMANLMNTAMNKSLFAQYATQNKWWEPLVTKTDLANFKQQQRVRLQNFGSLTERTVDGAEYTEMDWGEVSETFTPTGFGNVVTVGRRAVINDDLRGIQRIPQLMAASAVFTINEYAANTFFLPNSGNGPTLTDGVQVFNAASHQGNRGTTALDRPAVNAGRHALMKMQNDAGKIIGLSGRAHLVTSIDLEDVAYELIKSGQVPESANNAPNILADPSRGLLSNITVPQFTDTNNWYLILSPSEIECIEMGFVLGQESPATFVQDQPSTGMVFTNDVMAFKIRHEYGGDWLDYRGGYASIVA